jgi:hypothetical protein
MIRFKIAPRFACLQAGSMRAITMTFLSGLLALLLHVVPGAVAPAHAQGTRKDDIVFNSRGIPLAGATVRVCAMPASGQPCTPLALIYSDAGLTQALANPTTTDGMGNYFFYAAPGKYEIEISGPNIATKQIPNVILPNDPASPTFSAVSAFSLTLSGNLTVSGNTTVVGNLASGTLNVTNQSTAPGTPSSGTVNLYTKTADKRLYYKDDTGTEIGPLGPGNGAQTNVSNTFTAPQNIDADFHTKGPNPSFDLLRYGGYTSGLTPPTITCNTTVNSNQITCSGGVSDFLVGHGVAIPTAGVAPTMLAPGTASAVTSISVSSNVATVAPTAFLSFTNGSNVVIAGSSDSAFNGTFPVAGMNLNGTFTFNVTHANCSPCAIGSSTTVIAQTPGAVTPQGILNGSTTWNYKIVAIGFHGELSAASPAFTTTTGASSLGVTSATIAANGCVENNGVVTFTTTANHNFQSGVPVNIPRSTTGTGNVEGSWTIASVPSSTTFTVDIATLSNGTYCPSGGTAQVVAKNLVQWTMQPYSVLGYYIYRSKGAGAYSLVGVSQGMDSAFIDWGLPAPAIPSYVPATPPSSTTNGILATTITNINGTTVTLAANAVATVSSATVNHDNTPNILSVCSSTAMGTQGGTIFFPASNPEGNLYVINSPLNLSACPQNTRLQLGAQPVLNYPVLPSGGNVIEGTIQGAGGNGAGPSFGRYHTTRVLGNAYPFFLLEPGQAGSVTFINLNTECSQAYQSCFVQDQDNNGNNVATITYDNVYMSGGNYAQTFKMGGGFGFHWHYGCIGTAALAWGVPPSFWDVADMGFGANSQQLGGIMDFFYTWMGGGEWLWDSGGVFILAANVGQIRMEGILNESSYYPSFRFNLGSNPMLNIDITRHSYADPVGGLATPIMDLTNAPIVSTLRIVDPSCASSSQAFFSGNPGGGIEFISGTQGCGSGLPSAVPSIFENLNGGSTSLVYANVPVAASGAGQFSYGMSVPAAPQSAVVSSGGSVPVGTHSYALVAIDVNGKTTTVGPSVSATTTSGNQTVTITPPATPPAGAIGYGVWRDGVFTTDSGGACFSFFSIVGTSATYVDTHAAGLICGNSPPGVNAATVSALTSAGINTNQIVLSGGGFKSNLTGSFTANRSQVLADASGVIPVTTYLNSAYDNFSRANGGLGSNWTTMNAGLTISSNQVTANTGSDASSLWAAGSSFAPDQFSEFTVTSYNGTAEFPGVLVRASGTNNWYSCLADSTTIFLQKNVAGTKSNLSSGSSTGAAGDVIRAEVQGSTITCYKNGAAVLTATDTALTSGSPGFEIGASAGTAAVKNWSGGNLHPLAHLDVEQDWTKPQHFTQGIAFGTETVSASPRGVQSVFLPGALTSTWTGSTWTLDKAVTVTRIQVQAKTAPAGCSTNAVIRLTDGTSPVNLSVAAAANDSGPIIQNYAAGASLTVAVQTAAAGCTTNPADANVLVQYRMQ